MTSAEYLEAAKIEDLTGRLRGEGYEVERDVSAGSGARYDLVASKGGRRTVYEVKARSALTGAAKQIAALRARAHADGFDDFRLVVVSPPRETNIEIPGLEEQLLDYITDHMPSELDQLSTRTQPQYVVDLELSSVEIDRDTVRVVGSATLDTLLEYAGGEDRGGAEASMAFPFDFEVLLDRDLDVEEVDKLKVDTSAFYE